MVDWKGGLKRGVELLMRDVGEVEREGWVSGIEKLREDV